MFHNEKTNSDLGIKYLRHIYKIYNEFLKYDKFEDKQHSINFIQNNTGNNSGLSTKTEEGEDSAKLKDSTKFANVSKDEEAGVEADSIRDPSERDIKDYDFDPETAPPLSPSSSPPQKRK
jgi:hypothetical protein